ncbi:MAG: sigma-70 family RNA polymerase sigma factor [Thermodesulfovibrionales bacterium]
MTVTVRPGRLSFQEVHDIFRPKILRYLARLVGEQDAEDLTQDVFVKVSHALETFRGEATVSTWIYRIATNAAMDHLRKPSSVLPARIASFQADDDTSSSQGDKVDGQSTPCLDAQLIRKEMSECIRGLVDDLPEDSRTVLVLSELEELSNHEIAEILQVSLETVKIRLHRARAKLKKEMENRCNFYRDDRNELACDRKITPLKFHKK